MARVWRDGGRRPREEQLCSIAERNRANSAICAAGIKVMRQCYAANAAAGGACALLLEKK